MHNESQPRWKQIAIIDDVTPKVHARLRSDPPLCRSHGAPRRHMSSENIVPVDLDYASYIPPNGNKTDGALVILHGLFGSKRNFTSLSKLFMKDLNIPVYALDLRNQGTSPRAKPMTYPAMAADVLHFIHSHRLSHVSLLGHSMGGKAAMSVALHPSLDDPSNAHLLSKLIVADVAPMRAELCPEFKGYIAAMRQIEDTRLTSRKDALRVLEAYEPDPTIRQFLLTNLNPTSSSAEQPQPLTFRVPLATLDAAIPEIGWFPHAPGDGDRSWDGPVLFVKGSKSAYINPHAIPTMRAFFPRHRVETLDAGHWVHGERPEEFRKLVEEFIRSPEA
ncbi:putative alpha beta-hydrolase [Lyophyllum shimeji]|uniref:Alpha beta-hydrolase n=1 Tax=Lyophyllum shimeji TaxID=47721 RepID=A0A9P3Q0G9_LYOSH|nr:putative alpha beta-hydrolase [Lyophyllum shimeji]